MNTVDKKPDSYQETVYYEPDSFFLVHQNYTTEGYPNHCHNAVEIIMPIKNGYTVIINRQPYHLRENDILIVPPGELHEMIPPEAKGLRIILQFSIEVLNTVRGFIGASYIFLKPWLITPEKDLTLHPAIRKVLFEVLNEYLSRKVYYNVAVTNKIIEIALHLTRKKRAENEQQYEALAKRKEHTERLSECLDYINQHFNENLTLEMVAQAVGFSKFHFSRWFREFANLSFHEYLVKIRIDKAEASLLSTSLSVTEIAMESGFQSTNTFNRLFKKYKNCTPTEYRYLNHLKRKKESAFSGAGDDELVSKAVYVCKTPAPADVPGTAASILSRINPDGTFRNPFLWADVPDPDVIRVNDTYYMVSTTMYFCPGIPVMKSYDLVNWTIVNYVYDILGDSDACALRNGAHAYGKGSWAASLRFHKGIYYVAAVSFTTEKTYIFQTEDIENGSWRRYELDGIFHDPSMLFDDDDRVYLIYGGGTIRIIELTPDATAILSDGINKIVIENANAGGDSGLPAEGSHIYKIDNYYYLFLIAWPKTGSEQRIELCYRSERIDGFYEGRVVLDDDLEYKRMGVAQGGIVDTPDGSWYAMLFQDHGAVGRIPVLVPVTWSDGWPVFGLDGCVPANMQLPSLRQIKGSVVASDEFYPSPEHKEYGACNGIDYRYRHMAGSEDESETADEELLVNTRFEDGIEHWGVMENADIAMAEDETIDDMPVLLVTSRTTTASGPRQVITGRVRPGGVYEVSAYVKYISGPPSKVFNICIRHGDFWEGIQIMGSGRLLKGEWGFIRGTYTLPDDADLSETSVFVETPWFDNPKKEADLMDFYVGAVSVIAKPVPRNTKTERGENDPGSIKLALPWQWNHNPDHNLWTLTERPGYLRLKSGYLKHSLIDARNTLTQRTFGPVCAGTAAVDVGGMKDGDVAGMAALQELYGYIGVKVVNGEKSIVMVSAASGQETEYEKIPLQQDRVYLRIDFDFDGRDEARFYYSLDEVNWHAAGEVLPMQYKLSHFTGYRFALFYYATQVVGGYADFGYFRLSSVPMQHNETLKILNASFGGDTGSSGVKNAEIEVSIHMDALPEGDYKGIYLSLPVPDLFDVGDVIFCKDNITGNAVYTVEGRQLCVAVTGERVPFANRTSDLFATLRFTLNDYVAEDTVITLQPDYIYVDGGNAAYLTHDMRITINIKAIATGAAAKLPGYANPLVSHKYGADPWALEYGGRLYLYLTGDEYEYDGHGRLIENTYQKINTINVISSADLLNWTDHGAITVAGLNGAAKWAEHSWAPAVACRKIDGKDRFFLYFANDASNIGVLAADSPTGPWSDPIGKPLIHRGLPGVKDVTWCFDPAVLVDDDGQGYLYFGGGLPSNSEQDVLHPRTARVIKLGDDMVSTVGEAVAIDAPALFEDSGIHKYNGVYYYSYCSNFVGSRPEGYPPHGEIAYMTADSPIGPFTYRGTILRNPSHFFDVGGNNHHCIFSFKDRWYITYHAQTLAKALDRVKGYRSPHINCLSYYGDGQIRPVSADMKGAALPETLDPYQKTPAATIAWCAGIETAAHIETGRGMYVTRIRDGGWLGVANVDFGKAGASSFSAHIASRVGCEIEIRLDSIQGKVIGALGCGSTGGEDVWAERICDVKSVFGVHDVFFVFRGDGEGNLFNFDYWQFE